MANKQKQFVLTKGGVHKLLVGMAGEMKQIKSVKDIYRYIDEQVAKYIPQGPGRKSVYDFQALQSTIDEAARILPGAKASTIVNKANFLWNRTLKSDEDSRAMSPQKFKMFIVKGRLSLPDGFAFEQRTTKKETEAVAETTTVTE